jgi:hypothetical protein
MITKYKLNSNCIRRVWGYQGGDQNPHIEEEQTTQWPKEKNTKRRTTIYKACTYN